MLSAFYRKREKLYIRVRRIERFSIMWLSFVKMIIYHALLDIILTYSSLFLPTFFNARVFVTTSWLRIFSWWVFSKKPSKKKETKENHQTMDFGVSAFSIALAFEWNFVFLCEFSDGSVFTGAPLKVPKQTNHLSFLFETRCRKEKARWKRWIWKKRNWKERKLLLVWGATY